MAAPVWAASSSARSASSSPAPLRCRCSWSAPETMSSSGRATPRGWCARRPDRLRAIRIGTPMVVGDHTGQPPGASNQIKWHAEEPDDVARLLGSGPDGLTTAVAAERLQQYGPNQLEEAP